jgi:hypothetical protein
MGCLTRRRLIAYPWIVLAALWGVLVVQPVAVAGLRSAFGPVVGIDFIIAYTGGLLYRIDPTHLYDFASQLQLQRRLLYPTHLVGSGPFINPPFSALVFSWMTHTPPLPTFVCWSALQLLFVMLATRLAIRSLAPQWLRAAGLTNARLALVVFSAYPFVEGFIAGQMHGATLLVVTIICVSSLQEKDGLAGAAAGLLLYKPQFALGFVIIWIARQRWKSLLVMAIVGMTWAGTTVLSKGLALYAAYFSAVRQALRWPYASGFPRALMVTAYGLIASVVPREFLAPQLLANFITIGLAGGLAWLAVRKTSNWPVLIALAALFPLVATPYALTHDLLILVPVLVLLAHADSQNLLQLAVFAYVGSLAFMLLGLVFGIALAALLPAAIAARAVWLLLPDKRVRAVEAV